MHADIGTIDYLRELVTRLETAGHGQKSAMIQAAAEFLRCSPQRVWAKLKDVGYVRQRKPRSDRGTSKVPEELARKAAGMVHLATRAHGKRTLTIESALDVLTANGHGCIDEETGEIVPVACSPSTLARAMRLYNCHPEQLAAPTASVQMQSRHPNHVWQIDASVCVLFYLPNGGMKLIDEKEVYKNKPGNAAKIERERVIRYVVVDHFSGAFYLEYVFGAESAANLTQVFLNAIRHRGIHDPMHGVPFVLLQDRGSANEAHLFRNLLNHLKVEVITHLPGNPRAKGSVEKHNDVVERQFEGRLAFMRVDGLDHLNELATQWRQMFNAHSIHSRTKQPRNAVWLTIREDQLRLIDHELARDLVTTKPVDVKVRQDLTISHAIKNGGRNDYDLRYIPGISVRMIVTVVVNAYRSPAIDVLMPGQDGNTAIYTIEPMKKTEAGFYINAPYIGENFRPHADSAADIARKEIRTQAYGVETELAVAAKRKAKTPAYDGQINAMADVDNAHIPDYLPKRGRDLGVASHQREATLIPHIQAARLLKSRLGDRWSPDSYQWMVQRYPEGLSDQQIEEVYARCSTSTAAPLRVIGGTHAEA